MLKALIRWAFKARVARMERQIEFILAHPESYAWAAPEAQALRDRIRDAA